MKQDKEKNVINNIVLQRVEKNGEVDVDGGQKVEKSDKKET